ncbi:MAG: LGFP repeat-containing protein [Rhodoglobus sp.]
MSSVNAATASNWDPGYIIDDSIFYDSTSMGASEVQTFLDGQVSRCQLAAYLCLKGYGKPTETRAADRYCAAYQGAPYQTAAQIIDGVARACDINQRVLLVLLQKEQGLVTSSAPSARAFEAATGMSCPDTAECDPQFAGFFYQVYFAARQFQIYRLNPTSFRYQAQRWNNILLNPNADCGTQSVFIANQATAALYIYTPYVPNGPALANLYGVGDRCSSYGNRNFWRIFTDWFGNPQSYSVADGLMSYWNSSGGATGHMGKPISYLVTVSDHGGGSYQRFQGGTAYASYQAGTAFVANNVIGAKYSEYSGQAGPLGWPSSEQMCAPNGVCFQVFTGATITTSASTGTHIVGGGLSTFWAQSGGPYTLGAALAPSDYSQGANGIGWAQRFQRGTIVQSVAGTYVIPRNGIEDLWLRSGGGRGFYGWPTGPYSCVGDSCAQPFQGGVLSSTPTNGVHSILWGFESYWTQSGGLNDLGAALTDIRGSSIAGGGWVQQFVSTAVTVRPDGTTIRVPYGGIWNTWIGTGAEAGYGWPVNASTCVEAACGQRFQHAEITTSPQGNFAIIGGFTIPWETFGGLNTVGPASTSLRSSRANGGGWSQQFTGGVITQTSGAAAIFTPTSPILNTWQFYGAETTWLGWPVAAQQCDGATCTQRFQYGNALSNSGGVMFTR